MNQKRTPAGVPTGGEFAANAHDEAPFPLDDAEVEYERWLEQAGPINDALSSHTYGGIVGEVNEEVLLERYPDLLEKADGTVRLREEVPLEGESFAGLERDIDFLNDYPSIDDEKVSERENALIEEHLRETFRQAGGQDEDFQKALDSYRENYAHSAPASVESSKDVYFHDEDDWIAEQNIEDEDYRFESTGIDDLGADYLDKNSEAVIGFFEEEYGATISFEPGAWDQMVVHASPENEDGRDLLAGDNYEKYRNGGTNVIASKLQAYIDRVNS